MVLGIEIALWMYSDGCQVIMNGFPIPYEASIADLRNSVKTPDSKAWASIRALAEKNDPEALAILLELTHSKDWRFRRSAAEAIGISPLGQQATLVIENLLYDPNEYVIHAAMDVAAKFKMDKTHDRILALTKAPDRNTRYDALLALEKLWHPTDFEIVLGIYLRDPLDQNRKQAAQTIFRNVDADHWQQLFPIWAKDRIPRIRIWACCLIKLFGSQSDFSKLDPLINDQDGHVRKVAKNIAESFGYSGKVIS